MNLRLRRRAFVALALAATSVGMPSVSRAANGTWSGGAADGLWTSAGNWNGNVIADGSGNTADFNSINLTVDQIVTLNANRTIGNVIFGDTDTSTAASWNIAAGNTLTFAGTTPTVTVNQLGAGASATIAAPVTGTVGLTKAGVGTLNLSSSNNVTGGLSGGVNVTGGTLNTSGTIVPQLVTLSGGGVWQIGSTQSAKASNAAIAGGVSWGLLGSGTGQPSTFTAAAGVIQVAAGQTGTIMNTAGAVSNATNLGQVGGGAGSTLNLLIQPGSKIQALNSWRATSSANTGGNLGALNVSVNGAGTASFVLNASTSNVVNNADRFDTSSLGSTAVTINDGVTVYTRAPSGGNTITMGSLAGSANAILYGGRESGGSITTLSIGSLGTNTTYAGTITSEYQAGSGAGTTSVTKTGAGTLTLSGTLLYNPSQNATFARRGGITTVTGGTLALANAAVVPGGDATNNLSTINVQSAGTLDVSGTTQQFVDGTSATVTGYSAQANQQVIGAGTIIGNFNLANANLAPANTMGSSTSAFNNVVAGTMTFSGKLNVVGTGHIAFDITPSTSSGNDLIQVTNADITGTPTLDINRIGGASAGNYTIINSTNNLTGSAASWTVTWAGRGTTPTLDWTSDPKKLQLVVSASSLGGNLNWSGVGNSSWDINTNANWFNTAPAFVNPDKYFEGDNLHFLDTYDGVNAATNTAITLAVAVSPSSVNFNSSTTNYSFTGGGKITGATSLVKDGLSSLTFDNTISNDYTGTTTIQGGGSLSGKIGTGQLILNNGNYTSPSNASLPTIAVTAATTNAITTTGSGTTTFGAISGGGSLSITSSSVSDLVNNNSGFSGSITVVSGVVRLATGANPGGSIRWILSGVSTLEDNASGGGSADLGSLEGSGILTGYQGGSSTTSGAILNWNVGGLGLTTTFSGAITDGRSPSHTAITKVGAGTLTLSGVNTFTGNTTVSAGGLTLASSEALQNSTLTTGNTGLQFDQSVTSHNFSIGGLSGSVSLPLLDNATSPNPINLSVGGATAPVNSSYSGVLSGAGATLNKVNTGTLTLSGNNTYTGGTTISGGTLALGNAGAIGTTGNVTFAGSGVLQHSASNTVDYGARIANSSSAIAVDTNGQTVSYGAIGATNTGGLTKSGTGTLVLTGANSYTGATSVTTGTLAFGASQASVSGGINVASGATAGIVARGASGVIDAQPALVTAAGDPSGYVPGDKYVIADNVTVAAGGKFDVNDGILVINSGTFSAVSAAVQSGAIFSSTARYDANNLLGLTGLGMGDNFDLSYAGIGANNQLTITGSLIPAASDFGQQFIFKYTYIGDANLDGKVTTSDYDFVFGNLGSTTNGVTGNPVIWGDGDFNGNGVVDTTDLDNLFANLGFGTTGNVQPPLLPGTSVPEPSSVALLLLGLAGSAAVIRRKK